MNAVIYPTTNLKATEQMLIERGDGIYVYDNQGNRYIEGLAGLWCVSLGYGNKEIITAAKEQMERLAYTHMFGGKSHQGGIDLANKLAEMVPVNDARIFFGNSGSDANDTHHKFLRYYFNAIDKPQKRKIITRERAYHGVTVSSGSLTSLPATSAGFDLPVKEAAVLRTESPHYYHGAQNNESESEFVDRITNNLEQLIVREGPETIAAVIMEPITGASGVIVPPAGYYEKVQEILNRYDIFFWADEVITAFGRTGNDFGCTTMNIKQPDMMTLAKQLSSAYFPISASVIRGDMYEAMAEYSTKHGVFGHGYTYSGHPVACAIVLKVLEIYQRDNIFETAAQTGAYMLERLNEFGDHPLIGDVRGKGMIGAIELVANKKTNQAFSDATMGAKAMQLCQDNGLIVRAVAGNSIALCPPLITTEDQIDEIMDILHRSLNEALEYAQQQKMLKE